MKKALICFIFLSFLISCSHSPKAAPNGPTLVTIQTTFGSIKIRLYDETKLHKENFLKLIQSGTFDGLLFHRIIKGFMIQGGDPTSKNVSAGQLLGNGDLGYTLPAEILSQYYHKRGALAAAREGDQVNPEQRSSASQFYIVDGRTFTDEELDNIEKRVQQMKMQNLYLRYFIKEKSRTSPDGKKPDINIISANAADSVQKYSQENPAFRFSEQQRTTYKTSGGAPHLDGSYTVFGEVIEGMDVVDKIASQPVDANNRPLQNIPMKITINN